MLSTSTSAPGRRVGRLLAATAAAVALTATGAGAAHAAPAAAAGAAHQKELIGYFTQWGIYSGFFEKKLVTSGEINHLTELDYAFSDIAADGTCSSGDPWADYQRPFAADEAVDGQGESYDATALHGNFNQLRELKAANPHLKIVMSIGGWSWSKNFSQLALTAEGRQKFVASCVDQYIKGDIPGLPAGAAAGIFDGISVDWEYPGAPGNDNPYGPQDTPDFTALMQEFRSQLDAAAGTAGDGARRKHYVLTANTSANPTVAANLELRKLARVVDWFNVMTFDYHGSWEPTGPTDHASALFQDPRDPNPANNRFSVAQAVQYYEQQGVKSSQIGIAIPYYAHTWTGVAPGPRGDGLFQAATAGGDTPNYNAVVNAPGKTYWDPFAQAPYKYDAATGTFYSYDDTRSVAVKGAFINAAGLRGTFVWSMDGDTADGQLTAALGTALNGR
ncbi:glycoside hydrolase family 18 protein [Streptacidiphilus monticola]|uniref:chitinase n=1 Tax=Streptacidiphilus monticola TaxID=2161674 RepID=A0ABW1G042_9ACTN